MPVIVLVEDNADWQTYARAGLRSAFPNAEIEAIYTESEFLSRIPYFQEHPPVLFIMDVMLPWSEPAPIRPEPPPGYDVDEFFRAGFRCQQQLSKYYELSKVPVVFWTVISREDLKAEFRGGLPSPVRHVEKSNSFNDLLAVVQQILEY